MTARQTSPGPRKSVVISDISTELEEDLMRRARQNGKDPATVAAEILERHVEEESTGEMA